MSSYIFTELSMTLVHHSQVTATDVHTTHSNNFLCKINSIQVIQDLFEHFCINNIL